MQRGEGYIYRLRKLWERPVLRTVRKQAVLIKYSYLATKLLLILPESLAIGQPFYSIPNYDIIINT